MFFLRRRANKSVIMFPSRGAVYLYSNALSIGSIVIAINATVHFFMYTYYALKAMDYKLPKKVSMALTSLQITQMLVANALQMCRNTCLQ